MKYLIVGLALLSFSKQAFAQQQPQQQTDNRMLYTNKIRHYHNMKSAGQALTFGGSALSVIGLIVLINAADNYDKNNTTSTNGTTSNPADGAIAGGLVTYLAGAACVTAGIPLWIVGGISKGRYERKLDSLSLKIKVNQQSAGLALCYRF